MATNGRHHEVAIINLRVLAALAPFTGKDDDRYYLQGVCIEIDARSVTYIGTDGVRLMAYREDLEPDDEDHELVGTFIIPAVHCKAIKLGKDDEGRATLARSGKDRLTIAKGFVDVTFLPIDGVYPHWRRVLPRGASGVPAQFDLKRLADVDKFAKSLSLSAPFIAHNGSGPAFVWFSGHPNVFGMVMPVKHVDEMARDAPQWARRGPMPAQRDLEDDLFQEDHDEETGEVKPKPDKHERAANVAIKAFGKPVELTEDEKAKGMTHAFEKTDGNRVSMSFPVGNRIGDALTRIIAERYGHGAETVHGTNGEQSAAAAAPPEPGETSPETAPAAPADPGEPAPQKPDPAEERRPERQPEPAEA